MIKCKLKPGDVVTVTGDSGFCDPCECTVESVLTRYDNITGAKYPVIVMDDGDQFDGRDGSCIKGASMYYIKELA